MLRSGPFRSGKVLVFRTCTPAVWSPLNGVPGEGAAGQPFFAASAFELNQRPRWKVWIGLKVGFSPVASRPSWTRTGTGAAPTATAKVSVLERPTKKLVPLPVLSTSTSPTYQPTPKGPSGTWIANRSSFVPGFRPLTVMTSFSAKPSEVTLTEAVALGVQAGLEGTMLKSNEGAAAAGR